MHDERTRQIWTSHRRGQRAIKPKREKQNEECLSQLVDMLQQANPREGKLKESVEFWKRKYHSFYQEHLAYILSDLCVDFQTRLDNAATGGCYEVCNECTEKIKTIAVLRRELAEKDERIRYWIDCYETALSQVSEFTTGSRHAEAVDVFQVAPHNFVTKRCLSALNSYEFQAKS